MHPLTHAEIVGGTVSLLLIAVAILVLSKRIRLPFTVILVLIGIVLSWLIGEYPHELGLLKRLEISPELILFVFLPTLIFESTFNLDARSLRRNLGPILTLAVPGLVLSTALIGVILWLATPLPLDAALLLGAILSATDPVAVIALFARIGAPQQLSILVEGESLFNDATSIVLARILVGVVAAGTVSAGTIGAGIVDFFALFAGGLVLGILLGLFTGMLIGMLESEPLVEITLVTALAYVAFLLAEEVFHVSGVMATMGAGLTMGGWGRAKISASVRASLEYFLGLLAFFATALIFLMVGLRVDLSALWGSLDLLPWVVVAMLAARAVLVFGLMPLVGRLPGASPISLAYQAVMFWGGLRGAIALAIVLSLPAFAYSDTFVALVMGAVLFTLLVQGLTIEPLVRFLRLHVPTLADQVANLERDLTAKRRAYERLPELQAGGLFSSRIARRLQQEYEREIRAARDAIRTLRSAGLDPKQELHLLYLHAFAEEGGIYTDMYGKGHLSEGAYRELMLVLGRQVDAIRYHGDPESIRSPHHAIRLYRSFDRLPLLGRLGEFLRMRQVIRHYEEQWGHFQGSDFVIRYLQQLKELESIPDDVYQHVLGQYRHWHEQAGRQLDHMSEQFPEFVTSMQERFGRRLGLLAEMEVIGEQARRGVLSKGKAEEIEAEIARRLVALRGQSVSKLHADPVRLLRQVPLFRELGNDEIETLAGEVSSLTLAENEEIIRQGDVGHSLYLIARGVVRVTRATEEGGSQALGTLMAGDYFGEMALLHDEPRTATVKTVTACQLYQLKKQTLQTIFEKHPSIGEAIRRIDEQRRREQVG